MSLQNEYTLHSQLIRLLDGFTALLGIRIAVFTPDGQELQAGLNRSGCKYCQLLRKYFGFESQCRSLDQKMFNQAREQKQLVSYQCHGHLREAIIPLIGSNTLLGFLMIGQFRTRNQSCETLIKKLPAGQKQHHLRAMYNQIPCFDEPQLANILGIYQAISELTVMKGLFSLPQRQSIEPIIEFIRKNPSKMLSLEQASEIAGKSTSSISHLFKRLSGQSFKQYQIDYKLSLATTILESHPEKTIAEIALRVGFADPFYFSRLFRKYKGLPPSQFRK
jgi:AraC-like DNA-binding protein